MQNFDLFGNPIKTPKTVVAMPELPKAAKIAREVQTSITQVATIETIAKFKNASITQVDVYRREAGTAPINPKKENNLLSQNGNDNTYNGYLSPATRRYIEQLMSVWLTSVEVTNDLKASKKEVNGEKVFPTFVTLTLPSTQLHTDNDIKEKVLKPFIKWLTADSSEVYKKGPKKGQKKGFGVSVYFWRAEPQKNTRIHFHIICDKYVPWEAIRAKWNQCCEILGYVSRYAIVQKSIFKNGFKINNTALLHDVEDYQKIAKEVLAGKPIPENIPEFFRDYLRVSVKYNKPMSVKMIELCAIERQKATYEKNMACGFTNPPSTEIRAIRNLDSVTAYVIKYVAKKPTEKALAPNQKLIRDSSGEIMVQTMDNTYRNSAGEIEPIIVSTEKYVPQYEERKINGRIWGCSDTLRGYKPDKDEQIITDEVGRTFVKTIDSIDSDGVITEKLIPVPVMKYFTKKLQERSVFLTVSDKGHNIFVSPPEEINATAWQFVDWMVDVTGREEVEAMSRKVGASFEKMNGRIIPYRTEKLGYPMKPDKKGKLKPAIVKQSRILKDFSPQLHREYVAYYTHVFNCIYNKAA